MNFSIRTIIREFVAPRHRLSCSLALWQEGIGELHYRGKGYHESGAFLLGCRHGERRRITRFVYYDDLDPHCFDTGIVRFSGTSYGPIWQLCREMNLQVVADIHTHPGAAAQSAADQAHPMVATSGHIALIAPNFAQEIVSVYELGIYEYIGAHRWHNHSGSAARHFFYIGFWG